MPILFAAMGTLKRGCSNHSLLSDSKFVGVGSTEPVYSMKSLGGFPSLIAGNQVVNVDVFEINQLTFERLDRLEGYREGKPEDSFFTRSKIKVVLDDTGEEVETWIYYVANPSSLITNPDYTYTDELGRLSWN